MIGDKEIQELVEYDGKGPVLSVYLDTDLAHKSKEAVKLTVKQLFKAMEEKPAASDVQAVEHFLEFEYDWQARGLALFVSGKELWKAIPLPIPVRNQVVLADKPYVRVLTDVLDRLGHYAVALIGGEGIRLFSIAQGRIQSGTEAIGEELKRHKQGGWSSARYQRRTENLAQRNLRQAVEITQAFCQQTGSQRLMLAGNAELVSQFKELLPKPLRSQVIGEFVADIEASPSEILNRSLDVAAQYDLEEEKKLVAEVITAAAKGGQGVVGLADTLYALHEGRVRLLLVEENCHASGYVCTSCGYVAADRSAKCLFCGNTEMSEVPDAVNRVIQKAIQTGVDVNIVRQNEALTKVGGIAALLRY
jgi:peptide subunit release factor 1 (eRF1)